MDFNTVRDHLISLDRSPRAPATQPQLDAFEHRFRVNLPTDVKKNYSVMNGADDRADRHNRLGATRAGLTATSFSEFIMKVAEDHGDLHSYG